MSAEIESTIESLAGDLPEAERAKAREILRACNFQDVSDPVFGLLRYWQLRSMSVGDKERPLAAEVRQMALELDNRLWETRYLKWGFFAASVFIAFFFGFVLAGSLNLYVARVNPTWAFSYFGLPKETAPDERLTELQKNGVSLRIYDNTNNPTEIGVGFKGTFDGVENMKDGEVLLKFRKQA
jgi:hypothetical protein